MTFANKLTQSPPSTQLSQIEEKTEHGVVLHGAGVSSILKEPTRGTRTSAAQIEEPAHNEEESKSSPENEVQPLDPESTVMPNQSNQHASNTRAQLNDQNTMPPLHQRCHHINRVWKFGASQPNT